MNSRWHRFNTILAALIVAALAIGCQTIKKKPASVLRMHLEMNPDGTDRTVSVPIGRSKAFFVNIEKNHFLDEGHVQQASVVDDVGGFQISLQFDKRGTLLLEQYTTANKGRRVAIHAIFGQERWLAAPVITQRISDGKFFFTPDATREEAERLVLGLNKVANKIDDDRK
jgi:preprotein translocase subunit SecD